MFFAMANVRSICMHGFLGECEHIFRRTMRKRWGSNQIANKSSGKKPQHTIQDLDDSDHKASYV